MMSVDVDWDIGIKTLQQSIVVSVPIALWFQLNAIGGGCTVVVHSTVTICKYHVPVLRQQRQAQQRQAECTYEFLKCHIDNKYRWRMESTSMPSVRRI